MRDFKDLKVWSRAHKLTIGVYVVTRKFPREELFGLTSQLRRCAASIGANLAEGGGRWSDGEMGRFVLIAMGSTSELEYHLLLSFDLGHIESQEHARMSKELSEIRRMLTALY